MFCRIFPSVLKQSLPAQHFPSTFFWRIFFFAFFSIFFFLNPRAGHYLYEPFTVVFFEAMATVVFGILAALCLGGRKTYHDWGWLRAPIKMVM
jgi:hypothetical protein